MAKMALLLASCLFGGESHYVFVFAHQDAPAGVRPDPHNSHSFACWTRVVDERIVERFNISWTGIHGVRFLRGAQPGRNLDLEATLLRARTRHLCVSMWGPYLVDPKAFERARWQYERLELGSRTGNVRYNVVDNISRSIGSRPSINCIHVLTDLCGDPVRTGGKHGIAASEFIVQEFYRRGVIQGLQPRAEWIWDAIRPESAEVAWRNANIPTILLPLEEPPSPEQTVDADR